MVLYEELVLSKPLSSGLVFSVVFPLMVWSVVMTIKRMKESNVPKLKPGKTYEAIAKERLRYTHW